MPKQADPQDWPLETYRGYLLTLARLKLGPRLKHGMSASDAVQETFLKAHKKRAQFRGQTEAEWQGWLRTILANTIKDVLIQEPRVIQKNLDDTSVRIMAWARKQLSPSKAAQAKERLEGVFEALDRLSEDERTAVELRYFQDPPWSLEEIARHINRPTPKAAAGVLFRALEKLRDNLRDSR